MRRIAVGLAAAACLLARAQTSVACQSDNDCKGDRVCQVGRCVEPSVARASSASDDAQQPGGTPNAHGGVHLGVAEFVQFGPTLTLEFGGGGRSTSVAGFVRGRAMNLGPLPYVIAGFDKDKFTFGFGAAAGLRIYVSQRGSLRGFYIGPAIEYISWNSKENDGEHPGAEIKYKSTFIMPQVASGYRWIFGKNFSLGVGGTIGYLVGIGADTEYDVGSSGHTVQEFEHWGYKSKDEGQLFGAVNCDLGFIF